MNIVYFDNIIPEAEVIIDLYISAGLRRPVKDIQRIKKMYMYSNLIITAWDGEKLVGIARALTDFCYCCYLSDIAVRKEYQNQGIGKKLIECIRNKIGEETSLLLLAAPDAMEYYPKIGFEKIENGFIIRRKK
jgi:N-acetylglutamate synthase-like GNAT family acetyltransferase